MMGAQGLTRATEVAILSANYIAARLQGAYEILYTGPPGRVAHECIIDVRPFGKSAGVTVEGIAKRLVEIRPLGEDDDAPKKKGLFSFLKG